MTLIFFLSVPQLASVIAFSYLFGSVQHPIAPCPLASVPFARRRKTLALYPPFPSPNPQHPQHAGKYETKLRSDPQQSRNKGATGGLVTRLGGTRMSPVLATL